MTEQDGLIGAYVLDGKGGGRALAWGDLEKNAGFDGPIWVHLDRNGEKSETWLREAAGIGQLQADALVAPETRPRVAFMDDGILIKDNHIAAWSRQIGNSSLAEAVKQTRESAPGWSIEVEVDTLDQLQDALIGHPDIVLLDNMTTDQLREAIQIRDSSAPDVLLEASGGISLQTVRGVAETGVNRISVGALTHSVPNFDLGFDFHRVA